MTRGLKVASYALVGAVAWAGGGAVHGQSPFEAKKAEVEGSATMLKVSSHLREARRLVREGVSSAELARAVPTLRLDGEAAEVEVRLDSLSPELVARLSGLGMELSDVSYRAARVVGVLDLELLDEVAAIPEVAVVHPSYGATTLAGSVDNQADVSIRADQTRSTFGVDGTGVDVGVLSDSFHDTIGGTASGSGCSRTLTGSDPQGSADLPASVAVLDNGPGGGSDEGAGMAELIHDLAPGAPLMFHTAFNSLSDFADGIRDLRDCGADVIVDDVIYFAEPMFQDGVIAQAVDDVVADGIPYFSSAGNQGEDGVDEQYDDSNDGTDDDVSDPPSGNDLHDFGSGDRFAAITLPAGCAIRLVLQWNDPFDGVLGPGASNDLDLYLCTSPDPADCTFGAIDAQGCSFGQGAQSGDPLEILGPIQNTGGAPVTVYMAVDHSCGDESERFRVATFPICGSALTFESGIFDQPQVYGHAAAAGANAVAAVFYGEIDSDGTLLGPTDQIDVENFSSLGGDLPFYFDGSGNPLAGAPATRFKPEMSAPDGTNTTFFGSDIAFDADDHPNFFGTSAAAPHAAAVAALLRQASPALAPNGVRQVLTASARDIETTGVDPLSGYGLVDALDATQTVSEAGDGCIDVLELADQTVEGTQFFRACDVIRAGAGFEVSSTGDLSFRAGNTIELRSGFSVRSGASFVAEIDPSLAN